PHETLICDWPSRYWQSSESFLVGLMNICASSIPKKTRLKRCCPGLKSRVLRILITGTASPCWLSGDSRGSPPHSCTLHLPRTKAPSRRSVAGYSFGTNLSLSWTGKAATSRQKSNDHDCPAPARTHRCNPILRNSLRNHLDCDRWHFRRFAFPVDGAGGAVNRE